MNAQRIRSITYCKITIYVRGTGNSQKLSLGYWKILYPVYRNVISLREGDVVQFYIICEATSDFVVHSLGLRYFACFLVVIFFGKFWGKLMGYCGCLLGVLVNIATNAKKLEGVVFLGGGSKNRNTPELSKRDN